MVVQPMIAAAPTSTEHTSHHRWWTTPRRCLAPPGRYCQRSRASVLGLRRDQRFARIAPRLGSMLGLGRRCCPAGNGSCAPCGNCPSCPICRSRDILVFVNQLDGDPKEHDPRRPALDPEGRFAIVTNVGRGMRWTYRVAARFFARTNDPDTEAKPCGPGLPTLRSSLLA
jgi:hypothetical protein